MTRISVTATRAGSSPAHAGVPDRRLSALWLHIAAALLAVVSTTWLLAGSASARGSFSPPDAPKELQPNIFYGSVPPGGESAPVVVFVHGLGGIAVDWWGQTFIGNDGDNDMYAIAYERGYRTAFVSLNANGERSPGNDMWVNGQTLARQIESIAGHYGVEYVHVVGHSKGGIDAQSAVVHYGADRRVRNIFTLSTPHQGSELADFAFTDEGRKLLELANLPFDIDGAVEVLKTDSMRNFRTQTDAKAATQSVRYFTAAGTDWGRPGVVLRLSGPFINSQNGTNDGLVTVASTFLPDVPCASPLFVQPYHHFNIHMGSNSFPWIDAAIRRTGTSSGCASTAETIGEASLWRLPPPLGL